MKHLISYFVVAAVLALAPSSARAAGADTFVIGASTGTALIVVADSPSTYYGVSITTGAPGDFFKCWNSTSTSGLALSSESNLLDVVSVSSKSWVSGGGLVPVALNASRGITCGKSAAGMPAIVRFNR